MDGGDSGWADGVTSRWLLYTEGMEPTSLHKAAGKGEHCLKQGEKSKRRKRKQQHHCGAALQPVQQRV